MLAPAGPPPTTVPTVAVAAPRFHGLDALRAWAMLLGVVLHAAVAFTPMPGAEFWPVHDPDARPAYALFIVGIHVWRMPIFFFISGFGCAIVAARRGPAALWSGRLRRVGLPLAVGLIVLGPAVKLAGSIAHAFVSPTAPGEKPLDYFYRFHSSRPVITWLDPVHLWFLEVLLMCVAAAVFGPRILARVRWGGWLPRRAAAAAGWADRGRGGGRWLMLVTGATIPLMLVMQGPGAETPHTLLPPPAVVLFYGLFFATGWAFALRPERLASLFARPMVVAAVGIIVGVVASILSVAVAARASVTGLGAAMLSRAVLAPVEVAGTAAAVLGLAQLAIRRTRPLSSATAYLADASYWTYLIHLPLVFLAHAAVAQAPLNGPARFLAVIAMTVVVCLASYHAVVRRSRLGTLLNGPSRARPVASLDGRRERPGTGW